MLKNYIVHTCIFIHVKWKIQVINLVAHMMLWNRKVKIIEETQLLKFVLIVNPNNSGFVSSIEIDAIIHTVFTSQFKNPYKQKTQTSRCTYTPKHPHTYTHRGNIEIIDFRTILITHLDCQFVFNSQHVHSSVTRCYFTIKVIR